MIPVHVIVTGRNHGAYTKECLDSLLAQDYPGLRIHWVDDASDPSDQALAIATEHLNTSKHRIVANKHRCGGIENFYKIACSLPAGGVVMSVGGDDKLLRDDAISIIAEKYDEQACWFTNGSSWRSDNAGSFSAPALHDDFRTHPFYWLPSSWRTELTPKVLEEDLKIGGWFFHSAGDVALYTPILEMTGLDRIRFINQTIYWYRKHEQNDGAVDARFQEFCGWMARCKPRYSRLEEIIDSPTRTPHVMPWGLAFPPTLNHPIPVTATVDGERVTLGPY